MHLVRPRKRQRFPYVNCWNRKNKGGVAFYKLNTLGGLFAQKIYKKTGFCDEVVYLDEKLN